MTKRIAAEEKLKSMGYKICKREEAPDYIKATGGPDVIAKKNGEWIIAEVKPIGQLARYSAHAKVILITSVNDTRKIQVWGIKELEAHGPL